VVINSRTAPYLNNIVEQDHRFIKKRIAASLGFRSVSGAVNTIGGYEEIHMIRKGQVRWWAKGDVAGAGLGGKFRATVRIHWPKYLRHASVSAARASRIGP